MPPRRLRPFALRALVAAAVVACLAGPSISAADTASTQLLVKFTPGADRAALVSSIGGKDSGVIQDLNVRILTVPSARAAAALGALRSSHAVTFAEQDVTLRPQEVLPDDPYFLNSGSWNLGGGAWGWYATHVTQAWDITKGSPSTVIAILDTGLKPAGLADFGGQVASTWNVMSGSTDVTSNAGNHGTYVAGVAALAADNGVGNAGYCPQCRLMIVQVGTDTGATLANISAGLTYAADHGARVANMSWAGTTDSATLQSAIDYAHSKGLVLTAAAGNSNCNCATYPSADQNVLGVAGVADANGTKQGDSNYGSWVKVAAPEGDMTAWPILNGAPGYSSVGGTSMAAPVVAGIAGLLISWNPQLTNAQVEHALESTAAPVSFTLQYGRVDALAALQSLGATDPQVAAAPVQYAPARIYAEQNGWTSIAPLTAAPAVGQVLVRGIGGWTGSAGLAVTNLQWQRCDAFGLNCAYLTNTSTYTVQSVDTGSTLKLALSVKNGVGTTPTYVLTQPVVGAAPPPSPPAPPVNSTAPAITGTAQQGQTLTASAGSWSGSPTSYAYQWQRCSASCVTVSGAAGTTYLAQPADVGSTLRVVVTASNSAGSTSATSAASGIVSALPPLPPPPPPTTQTMTFSGSLNNQNPSRSFSLAVGNGTAHASLSFNKCSSLTLTASTGASRSGPSVLSLDTVVSGGTVGYAVGGGRCSFTLTVVSPSP